MKKKINCLRVRRKSYLTLISAKETAEVFDDMLDRSVPLYRELQRMFGEQAVEFAQEGRNVYDLGFSTGITLTTLQNAIKEEATLIGADYSKAMKGVIGSR